MLAPPSLGPEAFDELPQAQMHPASASDAKAGAESVVERASAGLSGYRAKTQSPPGAGFRTFPNGLKAWGEPTLTDTCVSTAIQQ